MKVGDFIMETPTFYSKAGIEDTGPQLCEVVGIHPQGRFYRVRFTAKITGETWTECKYFPDRAGKASGSAPETSPRLPGFRRRL